jgi:hypothetical protein
MLTTPAPFPTPVGCLDPEPCSEVFDAQCVIYTGTELECNGDPVVLTNTPVSQALADIIEYFCAQQISCTSCITETISCAPLITISPGDSIQDALDKIVKGMCDLNESVTLLGTLTNIIQEDLSTLTTTVAVQGEELAVLQNDSYNYQIGQYVSAQGGVIFHRWKSVSAFGNPESGPVENYLVVGINNLSTSMGWGLPATDVVNAESTWDGDTNTTNIVVAGGVGVYAAYTCSNSTANGKSDWYLPALDELSLLWQNRWNVSRGIASASGTAITPSLFWSSTELDANTAWHFNAYTGTPGTDNKSNVNYVRAVRKFSI